jgi:hypothetical protein
MLRSAIDPLTAATLEPLMRQVAGSMGIYGTGKIQVPVRTQSDRRSSVRVQGTPVMHH